VKNKNIVEDNVGISMGEIRLTPLDILF